MLKQVTFLWHVTVLLKSIFGFLWLRTLSIRNFVISNSVTRNSVIRDCVIRNFVPVLHIQKASELAQFSECLWQRGGFTTSLCLPCRWRLPVTASAFCWSICKPWRILPQFCVYRAGGGYQSQPRPPVGVSAKGDFTTVLCLLCRWRLPVTASASCWSICKPWRIAGPVYAGSGTSSQVQAPPPHWQAYGGSETLGAKLYEWMQLGESLPFFQTSPFFLNSLMSLYCSIWCHTVPISVFCLFGYYQQPI